MSRPRLLRTDTRTSRSARIRAKALTRSSDGRVKSIPGASFNGRRLTFAFSPATITAKVGDVVTWSNNDSTGHTATMKADGSCTTPTIAAGSTGSIKFTAAGTYDYFCKIHPNMTGQITVS